MGSRLELHNKLIELFGSNNVYYQPPEDFKISYPAIIYSKEDISIKYADNKGYDTSIKKYNIIVVDKKPDNKVIDKILELPLSSYDRHYNSDNLNHDSITLYY